LVIGNEFLSVKGPLARLLGVQLTLPSGTNAVSVPGVSNLALSNLRLSNGTADGFWLRRFFWW
jgi:hypothetical protein